MIWGKIMVAKAKIEEKNKGINISKIGSSTSSKRLDLNDLLKRAKEKKIQDKKNNIAIFSGALIAVIFLLIIFSI
tara:strand:- start:140 stop:364 length:225 start_codon:yes stop_codon:yes gene_type:complete